ncbi:MAG: hypothetical protein HKN90_08910 [Flavobacteriaceae bacterium]|nr:hypothetical protein [Flavobacteriaceae bacterium]
MTSVPKDLKEVSALERTDHTNLFWMIQDAGNENKLYGLNEHGSIEKTIEIEGIENNDWEDLTADTFGNIFIGDFGNNSRNRKVFSIYKIAASDLQKNSAKPIRTVFTLPKKMKSEDFEAFFIFNDHFYIFSKRNKKTTVIKVPNKPGKHKASFVTSVKLKGKKTKITSADISSDHKTVILLNHNRVWRLTDFDGDQFFEGKMTRHNFNYKSQKEGICFKNDTTLYISDERKKRKGGRVYLFNISN